MPINQAALNIIKEFETLHDGDLSRIGLQPKLCPAMIWTIGYGHALRGDDGEWLRGEEGKAEAYRRYDTITEHDAEVLLLSDTNDFERDVKHLLHANYTDNQLGAMVSLAYNIGMGGFGSSSVLRFFNAGKNMDVANAFRLWNKSGGKVLRGLVRRREAERLLFLA